MSFADKRKLRGLYKGPYLLDVEVEVKAFHIWQVECCLVGNLKLQLFALSKEKLDMDKEGRLNKPSDFLSKAILFAETDNLVQFRLLRL